MAVKKADRAAQQRARWIRWLVLGGILAGMTAIVTAHQLIKGSGRWLGVDALCPFGGLETLYSLLTGAGFIRQTAAGSLILLIGMLAMALVYRRSFCGTICPLGALQGIFGSLGRRLFRRRFTPPRAIDRPARLLKYVVLALFAVWTWSAAELVMKPYDPWAAWAHLTSDELLTSYLVGFVVLLVSLGAALVYDRFFCKYLCPAGALLGLLSRVSLLNIRRDPTTCIDCGRCDTACMMNVAVATATVVRSSECISCNECVNACPVAGALTVTTPTRRRAPALAATAVVIALMVAIVGGTTLSGQFEWRQQTLADAAAEQAAENDGAFDTSLIKGRTTLQEISEATGISTAEITAAFGVPAEEQALPMSETKDVYGFSPEDLRAWVAERLQQ